MSMMRNYFLYYYRQARFKFLDEQVADKDAGTKAGRRRNEDLVIDEEDSMQQSDSDLDASVTNLNPSAMMRRGDQPQKK